MRKIILALVMTLALLSTFTIGASAHAVQKLHVAQGANTSTVHSNASGGYCRDSSDGRIRACVSENAQRTILPDGYLNVSAGCYSETIVLYQNGVQIGSSYTYQPCTGHFYGPSEPAHSGDQYFSAVSAVYTNGTTSRVNSPLLFA